MANNNDKKVLNVPTLRFPEFSGEWEKKTIGEISTIKNGPFGSVLHAEDYVDEGMPIVTTEHFKNGNLPLSKNGIPQVSDDDYYRLRGYKLEKDDIVFSRVGSIDINAHVEQSQQGWLFSGRVLRVRPIKSVNSLCLHYILSTESVKRSIRNRAVGQTMPSINTPILSNTKINIPQSVVEQKKIATVLQLLDERIATQNKIIERYQSLIRALALKLTSQFKETRPLSDLVQYTPSTLKESDSQETGEVPVYGASGICGYVDFPLSDKDSILITKDGSGVGTIRYVSGQHAFVGTLASMSAKEGTFLPYVYFALMNLIFTAYKTGLAIPHIYFKDYGKAEIPCPVYEEQVRIATGLMEMEEKLGIEHSMLNNLQKQKNVLLKKLFI